MRCTAYCTASRYNLKQLHEYLSTHYRTTLLRDVIHVAFEGTEGSGDCFFFSYGAWVCWRLSPAEVGQVLDILKDFEEGSFDQLEVDYADFIYGETFKVRDGHITLADDAVFSKLAISHGLAQSVKLSAFERAIQRTYDSTKTIPEELSQHGSIGLSRREIRQRMGELFNVRSSINLRMDVLDSPDFFWDYPELEPLYMQVAADEELHKRVDVLNKRLNVIHELFEMLGTELHHQHSSRLEWTIIWLIIMEVILTLSHDVFKWL
jgi:uncharacterized Rmd1/YagE family protein